MSQHTPAGAASGDRPAPATQPHETIKRTELTEEQWKQRLTPEQFRILRAKGTERPFCSPLLDVKQRGYFVCVGCKLPLFDTSAKFNSGTGWPSFFQPVGEHHVYYEEDRSHGMIRTEILCAGCDGHLGHVFKDGPAPTGLRFCINGEVLEFVPVEE